MPRSDNASVSNAVRADWNARQNAALSNHNSFNRREFERIQLLCRLGLPIRQFLPAVLPYLRELIPASCAFVVWSDTPSEGVLFCRESQRAIVLETNTPEAVMAWHVLRERFSGAAHHRQCHLIPPHQLGLEGSQSAYRPAITAVLAARLGTPEVPDGYLCLCRSVFARPFSRAEQSSLVRLASVFTRALCCDPDEAVATTCAISSESGMFVANVRGQVQIACVRAKKFLSMVLESKSSFIAEKHELPTELKQHLAEILNPGKPAEAVWCYRNSWGDFLFRARLLRETSDPASRSVAVTVTREEPLSLHVFRKCRQLSLTPRQMEIVLALARGESFPHIGKQLNVSTHTAIDHVRKLCRQFGVSNRYALVVHILT